MLEGKPKRLSERVVKRLRDGRRWFDPQAKRELIEASLRPGVSVAGLALEHGVNANQLRKWIRQHQRRQGEAPMVVAKVPTLPTFIPVVAAGVPVRTEHRLRATLRNGVEVDFGMTGSAELPSLLQLLDRLPCSGSTRG
jgi:transposase